LHAELTPLKQNSGTIIKGQHCSHVPKIFVLIPFALTKTRKNCAFRRV